ncbi:hypothetical protein [Lactococcus petauri]|uniref:hypothetical protein n=1 Tax=Lactococcus petauri TaxID=1940789 RepID=UPI0018A97577|nr:hypothetical protein [Lactococcus petauri]MDC0825844.1 hypothetical protein [Lactococcus petauri]
MKSNNIKRQGGYSADLANQIVNGSKPVQSLSVELETQFKFEENKRTDEIVAYKAWFTQSGLPPFEVKFAEQIALPSYLSVIQFIDLQACEVGYNIYFRASGIKEVK